MFFRSKVINRDDYVEMSGDQLRRFCCKIIMGALIDVLEVIQHLIERHTPRPRGGHQHNNNQNRGNNPPHQKQQHQGGNSNRPN